MRKMENESVRVRRRIKKIETDKQNDAENDCAEIIQYQSIDTQETCLRKENS